MEFCESMGPLTGSIRATPSGGTRTHMLARYMQEHDVYQLAHASVVPVKVGTENAEPMFIGPACIVPSVDAVKRRNGKKRTGFSWHAYWRC